VLWVAYSSEELTRIISIKRVSVLLLVVEKQSIYCDVKTYLKILCRGISDFEFGASVFPPQRTLQGNG
jgi:hypothetical protein